MKPTIYTTPNCVQCEATKRMFRRAGVEFDSVDLSTDTEAYNMVIALGYSAAPVVKFKDEHWSGFRVSKIQNVISEIKSEDAHKQ